MTWFEFYDAKYEEYLKRSDIEKLFSPDSPNHSKTSPKNNKQTSKGKSGKGQTPLMISLSDLPSSPVGSWGVTQQLQDFLEVSAETVVTDNHQLNFFNRM